jgi:neuralized-like protein 4
MQNNPPKKKRLSITLFMLQVGNRVGIGRSHDGTMHLYLNGENLGIAASNIPKVIQSLCPWVVLPHDW